MSDKSTFIYLLNAYQLAAQAEEPAKCGYKAKREAVLEYVTLAEQSAAAMSAALSALGCEMREGVWMKPCPRPAMHNLSATPKSGGDNCEDCRGLRLVPITPAARGDGT